jgi:hypothetical protein
MISTWKVKVKVKVKGKVNGKVNGKGRGKVGREKWKGQDQPGYLLGCYATSIRRSAIELVPLGILRLCPSHAPRSTKPSTGGE